MVVCGLVCCGSNLVLSIFKWMLVKWHFVANKDADGLSIILMDKVTGHPTLWCIYFPIAIMSVTIYFAVKPKKKPKKGSSLVESDKQKYDTYPRYSNSGNVAYKKNKMNGMEWCFIVAAAIILTIGIMGVSMIFNNHSNHNNYPSSESYRQGYHHHHRHFNECGC
jgi:hypothetical protein